MTEYRKPLCEFSPSEAVQEPPRAAAPEFSEAADHAAADFTERRCNRFLSEDVAR